MAFTIYEVLKNLAEEGKEWHTVEEIHSYLAKMGKPQSKNNIYKKLSSNLGGLFIVKLKSNRFNGYDKNQYRISTDADKENINKIHKAPLPKKQPHKRFHMTSSHRLK